MGKTQAGIRADHAFVAAQAARSQAIDDCIKVARLEMDRTHPSGHGYSEYASGYDTAAERIASRLESLKTPSPPTSSGGKDG